MTGSAAHASVDGRLVPLEEALVRVDDPAFAWGTCVLDTARAADGVVECAREHVERLAGSVRELGLGGGPALEFPARVGASLAAYAASLPRGEWAVRTSVARAHPRAESVAVTAAGGLRVWHVARAVDPWPSEGVELAVDAHVRLSGDLLDRHKTSSRARHALAFEAASASGAWDALLLHASGDVVCGTRANLFVVLDGVLVTPPAARGALPGIARARVLAAARAEGRLVAERRVAPAELARAEEVFLTNSLQRVVPVRLVRNVRPAGPPGAGACARWALHAWSAAERAGNA